MTFYRKMVIRSRWKKGQTGRNHMRIAKLMLQDIVILTAKTPCLDYRLRFTKFLAGMVRWRGVLRERVVVVSEWQLHESAERTRILEGLPIGRNLGRNIRHTSSCNKRRGQISPWAKYPHLLRVLRRRSSALVQ